MILQLIWIMFLDLPHRPESVAMSTEVTAGWIVAVYLLGVLVSTGAFYWIFKWNDPDAVDNGEHATIAGILWPLSSPFLPIMFLIALCVIASRWLRSRDKS